MKAAFHQTWSTALDWLLPPRCVGCNSLGSHWCDDCEIGLQPLPKPICARCGLPKGANASCGACEANAYSFHSARSCFVYAGALRRAILHLKNRRLETVGAKLAQHMAEVFRETTWQADLFVPIPLATHRYQERGFNQAELLASPVAALLGVPYVPGVLIRKRETRPQFELPRSERWVNVSGVFYVNSTAIKGRSVVVVDDIMTTGATLDFAAKALLENGAETVYGLTLARALFESPLDIG